MENFWVKKIVGKIVGFLMLGTIAVALFGFITMSLWNAVLVAVLGVKVITFWQALGILILGKLLFGGFGGHWGRRNRAWKDGMREKWAGMNPEEREKLKQEWRNKCRTWGRGPQEPQAGAE